MCWCGGEVVDPVDDVTCDVGTGGRRIVSDEEPHCGSRKTFEVGALQVETW